MKMKKLLVSVLAAATILPASIMAQVDVNREKYPDYTDKQNPNWSLIQKRASNGLMRADVQGERPAYVNNAEEKYFPPVFNQDGGSCGSASRICYMFTYELNAYRDLDGTLPENYYPSHFVWLLTNGNSGKNEFVTSIGVPSAATYGGQTYSELFGSQDCANNNFGWMQGYDKWFEAMHNRMIEPSNFPVNVGTEEGREAVKNWLWNHNGDTDFKAGGICGIGLASMGGDYEGKIPNTAANSAAGVVGKKYVRAWGTQVDHAMTIVGYDDRIEFDIDGDGVYGEKDADEVGAWILVNSWGAWWANSGFIYCPYAFGGASFNSNGKFAQNWWTPEIYQVRKDYRPLRTIKLEMDYSRRSELHLSAGISADINATVPEKTVAFEHFKYAGDGNYGNTNPAPEVPMLGRWADGKLHDEPMEFGYDLTDLTEGFDKSMPLKYFFIINTKDWALGKGTIHNASIIDYEFDSEGVETPFIIPNGGVEIKNAGEQTIISVIVYGEPFYAPQNVSLAGRNLSWNAPMMSTYKIEGYNIYHNDEIITKIASTDLTYQIPTTVPYNGKFGVSAVYEGGIESKKLSVSTAIEQEYDNLALNLQKSGISIPKVFDITYNEATIEFYINANSLAYWNQSAGPGWGSFMMHADGTGAFTAGWDTSNRLSTTAGAIQVGQWAHIALVVEGNKMTAYVNGVQRGTCTSSTYSGIGGFGNLVFSADLSSYNNSYTDAILDEIRIWNKARTAKEIKNSYKVQFAGTMLPDGLIAYYKGDITTVNGKKMLREYISGNHAEILNSNYKSSSSDLVLPLSSVAVSAEINPVGDVYVGTPVELSAVYSDAVTKLTWTAEDAGIKDLVAKSITAIFNTVGEQKVSVVAENKKGRTSTDEIIINVKPEKPIDATFRASKTPAIVGEKVSFIVENPAFGQLYEWTIPGAEEKQITGLHGYAVFEEAGTQTVTLKITSIGGTQSATSSIEVEVLESAPKAAFEITPSIILKGEKTYLKDVSKYNPGEWEWTVESKDKKYVINGQHSSLTPAVCGVYDVTLKVHNDAGFNSTTRERALIVCNADSKNGLNFSGRDNAKVTAYPGNLVTPTKEITVDWWMNPAELKDNCLGIGESTATFLLSTSSTGVMSLSCNKYNGKSQSGYVIPNEWHHYTAILSGGFADFYRDGEYFSTSYISYYANIPSLAQFAIGNDNYTMNGQIDELRVWNKALTADEIKAVCNSPIENPESNSNLILYYDFNQSGGDVIDRSGNGNNGVRSGFGPDGDAWGLSKGVFCLNTEAAVSGDVTSVYLKNYKSAFEYDNNNLTNATVSNRFYAIKDWTIENAVTVGNITTGVHVDAQKSYCMTFTTIWDGFSTLKDHKVYQTITLPAGNYSFAAHYHSNWEGECGESYVVVAEGKGVPNTADIESSIAHTAMSEKGTAKINKVEFTLDEETEISLGLIVNMSDKQCMTIDHFVLERSTTEYIEANGETTSIDCITETNDHSADNAIYDLMGRKINNPAKSGIYIKNGKKIYIK